MLNGVEPTRSVSLWLIAVKYPWQELYTFMDNKSELTLNIYFLLQAIYAIVIIIITVCSYYYSNTISMTNVMPQAVLVWA